MEKKLLSKFTTILGLIIKLICDFFSLLLLNLGLFYILPNPITITFLR